jgi:hypothetical protein
METNTIIAIAAMAATLAAALAIMTAAGMPL